MKYFYDTDLLENKIFGDETESDWENANMGSDAEPDMEPVEPAQLTVTLTMEDGSEVICYARCIFLENEKEYMALDMGDDEIQIMELREGEDDSILLLPVEDDEEREAAFQAFLDIIDTERGEDYDRDQDREEN